MTPHDDFDFDYDGYASVPARWEGCKQCSGSRAVPDAFGELEACPACVVDAGQTFVVFEDPPTLDEPLLGHGGQSSDAGCTSGAETVADEDSGLPEAASLQCVEIVTVFCERCIAATAYWSASRDAVPTSVVAHVKRFHPSNGVGSCGPAGQPVWIAGVDWWIVEDEA